MPLRIRKRNKQPFPQEYLWVRDVQDYDHDFAPSAEEYAIAEELCKREGFRRYVAAHKEEAFWFLQGRIPRPENRPIRRRKLPEDLALISIPLSRGNRRYKRQQEINKKRRYKSA